MRHRIMRIKYQDLGSCQNILSCVSYVTIISKSIKYLSIKIYSIKTQDRFIYLIAFFIHTEQS